MNTNSSTGAKQSVNIPVWERLISVVAGGVLIGSALKNEDKKISIAAALAGGYLLYRGASGHCMAYELAGKKKLPDTVRNINIVTKLSVNKPRHEVFEFWRKLSNLPLFMKHLERVDVLDINRSHWVAKVPGGLGTIEWDAEIAKEEYGELLAWNSLPHASINNAGKVEFRDAGDNATELTIIVTYRAPFGDIGEGVASLLNPWVKKLIKKDVKNFKHYMEAGDIPTFTEKK